MPHEYIYIEGDAHGKLSAISPMPRSLHHRRENDTTRRHVEGRSFESVNASVRWLDITVSPICAEFASLSQELAPAATVKKSCAQASGIKKLQKLATMSMYRATDKGSRHKNPILLFSDDGRSSQNAQLDYLSVLLLDSL